MNVEQIADEVLSLLGSYLSRAGTSATAEAAEPPSGKEGELYETVRRAFEGDAYAEQTLSRAEEIPEQGRLDVLKVVLKEKMQAEPSLAETLRRLVQPESAGGWRSVIIGNSNISIGGRVVDSLVATGGHGATPAQPKAAYEIGGRPGDGVVQVFTSSTWLDLRPEREAVSEALQRMRETKYVGMEYFGSRDEDTEHASLDEVERSHIYLGILAGRYGSGITEAEYRHARKLNIPCFIYVKEEAAVAPKWRETDPVKKARLAALKADTHAHTVSSFRLPAELAAKVTSDLHRWLFDEYLTPRLIELERRGRKTPAAQHLLDKIRDFGVLDDNLLNRLKSLGYTVIVGDKNVDVGEDVINSRIIAGGFE
jgi:hypothetical protein